MSNLRQAAQQALEALEWNYNTDLDNIPACEQWAKMLKKTITALRAALAEPEQPVAWMFVDDTGMKFVSVDRPHKDFQPLYITSTPRKPEPLTDEEIVEAAREADLDWQAGWTLDDHEPNRFTTLARAIERAHGIGEQHDQR